MLFVPAKQVIVLFFADIYEFCNTKFLEDVYARAFNVCRASYASKSCGANSALDFSFRQMQRLSRDLIKYVDVSHCRYIIHTENDNKRYSCVIQAIAHL